MLAQVFVTVGSTSFDELISAVSSSEVLEALKAKGYSRMIIQTGRGTVQPEESSILEIQSYDFKNDIEDDIKNSSLIISHAGAGSIIQSLENEKPLIVVINDMLMDNHQHELAKEFELKRYLYCCYCRNLATTIEEFNPKSLKLYYRSDPNMFFCFFDSVMGY